MLRSIILMAGLMMYTGIYDYSLTAIDDTSAIDFGNFQGRKILIVNTASTSRYSAQYSHLETLYQQYKDSLVVVACPSNDFNHETDSDAVVRTFIQDSFNVHFFVSGKIQVKEGAGQSPLYSWLTHASQNMAIESRVKDDFQKYLVDKDGKLLAYFAPQVDPMDSMITTMIEQ